MNKYVYDGGALIAIDNRHGDPLRRHEARLARGHQVIVPAPVAAQVVREPARQARLMLTLRGCTVVPFTREDIAPIGPRGTAIGVKRPSMRSTEKIASLN